MRQDNNFLQGLYYDNDRNQFVECTGLYEESKAQWLEETDDARVLAPATDTCNILDDSLFGEGLSPRNADEFVALTWKEDIVLVLDRTSLE